MNGVPALIVLQPHATTLIVEPRLITESGERSPVTGTVTLLFCLAPSLPVHRLRFGDTDESDPLAGGVPDGAVFGRVSGVTRDRRELV